MASFSSLPMLVFFFWGYPGIPKRFNDPKASLNPCLGGASGLHDRISAGVGRPLVDPQRQGAWPWGWFLQWVVGIPNESREIWLAWFKKGTV